MPVLSRWGDWSRIEHDGYVYIVNVAKEDNPFDDGGRYIPWFYIHLTAMTAKNRPYEKHAAVVMAIRKTFNMVIMRKLEDSIRYYLDVWQPKYIAIGAYEVDRERRMRLYLSRLATMGYRVKLHVSESKDTQDFYYLERQ